MVPEPRLPPWPAATIDYQPWTVAERPLPVARTLSGLVGHALAAIRALEGFWAVFGALRALESLVRTVGGSGWESALVAGRVRQVSAGAATRAVESGKMDFGDSAADRCVSAGSPVYWVVACPCKQSHLKMYEVAMLKKFDSYRTPAALIAAAALAVGVLGSTGMRNLVVASGGAATETGPGEQQAPAKKLAPPSADEQKRLLGEIDEVYKPGEAKDPAAKAALARKLLEDGRKNESQPGRAVRAAAPRRGDRA